MNNSSQGDPTVSKDYPQQPWDQEVENDVRILVRLAIHEDLGRGQDWTTVILVPAESECQAEIVARQSGVLAGVDAVTVVLDEIQADATWHPMGRDGQVLGAGSVIGTLMGSARDILTAERTVLNLLGRLCGVATLTKSYCDHIEGTQARIYDTRKTTPGWRRLEKYAVKCGGGYNHRRGLNKAVMIKDNHLAFMRSQNEMDDRPLTRAAVEQVKAFLDQTTSEDIDQDMLIEVEVDSLDQLKIVLETSPDVILLDNMSPDQLSLAVALRDESGCQADLEASGGVSLATVGSVAATGVERISVGALTHSAKTLDIGLDWKLPAG